VFDHPLIYHYLVATAGILIVGGLAGMLVRSRVKSTYEQQLFRIRSEHALLLSKHEDLGARADTLQLQSEQWRRDAFQIQERNAELRIQIAELNTTLSQERKQSEEKIALLNDARSNLKRDFEILVQRMLEEKGSQMVDRNQATLAQLIDPLRAQIGDFKRRVEDVYDKETRDRVALHSEIHHLKALNQRIGKEALNLTRALKGDSKTRGNWGEVILERVLESSGLQKGREYEVQVGLRDREGRRYQPDAIVRLPDGKDVIIDAKVSLNAYEAYYSAEDPAERITNLAAHIESMRTHIRTLAAKTYEDLEGVRSLDYTLLFVPIEAAFLAAVEKDGSLFAEAFEKNIMVVSPSTLLVTLRTIQNIWRYAHQDRYALEIAGKAGALYDKFVGFVEALQEIGKMLDRARTACHAANDRLISGRGNLVRRTQELKALGVKAGKELPRKMLEMAGEDELDLEN
jgi:DNA recombination protein RmuC